MKRKKKKNPKESRGKPEINGFGGGINNQRCHCHHITQHRCLRQPKDIKESQTVWMELPLLFRQSFRLFEHAAAAAEEARSHGLASLMREKRKLL